MQEYGYHFYVKKDGSVYRGRPIDMVGAHAYGSNFDSIGICAEGDYSTQSQPDAQVTAIQELIAHIKGIYSIQKIQKHSDVCNTDCPSKNYRFNEIVDASITTLTKKGDKGDRVKQIQGQLILKGYSIGPTGVDGIFGVNTDSGVRRFQENNGLVVDGIVGKNTWEKLFN